MSDMELPLTTVLGVGSTLTGSDESVFEDFCNCNLQMLSRFWAEPTDLTGEESGLRSLGHVSLTPSIECPGIRALISMLPVSCDAKAPISLSFKAGQ